MNTLLQSLLAREQAQRKLDQGVRDSERAEAVAIAADLHAAFEPYRPQILTLNLRGDYGSAVPIAARHDHQRRMTCDDGIALHLGSTILPEVLRLSVVARQGSAPAQIRLRIERRYPGKSEDLSTFEPGHSAQDMVRALLEQFARYVHDSSLAAMAEAA